MSFNLIFHHQGMLLVGKTRTSLFPETTNMNSCHIKDSSYKTTNMSFRFKGILYFTLPFLHAMKQTLKKKLVQNNEMPWVKRMKKSISF